MIGAGLVRKARLHGFPAIRGGGEGEGPDGRQPNAGRGHPPRKGRKRPVEVPENAGDMNSGPNTNLEV